MTKKITQEDKGWYFAALGKLGSIAVSVDQTAGTVTYSTGIASDESHVKTADGEELVHGVARGPGFKSRRSDQSFQSFG